MESGQVIPVAYKGQPGSYTHSMSVDNVPGIIAVRDGGAGDIGGLAREGAKTVAYTVQESRQRLQKGQKHIPR